MLHLLKIEYLKVKNYTTFWVICLLYAAIVPLIFVGICDLVTKILQPPLGPTLEEHLSFPYVWGNVVWTASFLNVLLGVLVIVLTANDLTYRTQRQHVIEGISRRNVIMSKMLSLVVLAAAVALYTMVIGLIFGAIYSDVSQFYKGIEAVGLYFIQTLGYFAMAFLLAILIQRTALTIILFVVILMINFFIPDMVGEVIASFLPVSVIADLTPFPFLDGLYQKQIAAGQISAEPEMLSQLVRTVIATAYIILMGFAGFFILKKRDI